MERRRDRQAKSDPAGPVECVALCFRTAARFSCDSGDNLP